MWTAPTVPIVPMYVYCLTTCINFFCRQAVFERQCYRAVHNLQQVLKNKLKLVKDDATRQYNSNLEEMEASRQGIETKIRALREVAHLA